jgi:hypothetical protein
MKKEKERRRNRSKKSINTKQRKKKIPKRRRKNVNGMTGRSFIPREQGILTAFDIFFCF